MKLAKYLAGSKRFVLFALARMSLRVADRLLRSAFKGFRAGYLPLGLLRMASRAAGRLQRLSLRLWGVSTERPRLPKDAVEARKPLPECLTLLLQPSSDSVTSPGRRRPVPTRPNLRLRRF